MKISAWMLTAVMTITLALVGCSQQGGGGGGGAGGGSSSIDTSAVESSFQSAEATLKASADKAIAAVKSADYSDAVAELKKLADNANLTPEQKQAIKDLTDKVQKAITEAAGKAAEGAGKAMEDVSKSLPKQ